MTALSSLAVPPLTGRVAAPPDDDEQRGVWSQFRAALQNIGGASDAFAHDPDPQVRAIGQAARRRRQPLANDYFALGDRCAQLTLQSDSLNGAYAAKVLAAYIRAGQIEPYEESTARSALRQFARWAGEVAIGLGSYDALKVGLVVCERVLQLAQDAPGAQEVASVREIEARLRDELARLAEREQSLELAGGLRAERQVRELCDKGQVLLRQDQPAEAMVYFERALTIDQENPTVWLCCAQALTYLTRFNDALTAYNRALTFEPGNAGTWNSKGTLLMELGHLEPALECFEQALEQSNRVDTVNALYWLNKGKALFMLRRYQEARVALEQSHALAPSPESTAGLAACRELLNGA